MSNNAAPRDSASRPPPKKPSPSDPTLDHSSLSTKASSNNIESKTDTDVESRAASAKEELRIYKTISRVHRACNACRKQKARCDGPENPPCRRCRQVGIECIFEKPPKDTSATSSISQDTNASSDRIRALEAQMSGMQSMISELVASIKANTHAMSVPAQQQVAPQHSPSASSALVLSPFSSRAGNGRSDQYPLPHHHTVPLQQQPYAQHSQTHHLGSQQATSRSGEGMQRYAADGSATPHPQRPSYSQPSRSFGSNNSTLSATTGIMGTMHLHTAPGYPLQQPPAVQTAYGHPPNKPDEDLLQQQPDRDQFDSDSHHSSTWDTGMHASTSIPSLNSRERRRSGSRSGQDRREGVASAQHWQQQNLLASSSQSNQARASSSSPGDASATTAATIGTSGWTPTSTAAGYHPSQSSRRRWTSSDRANSYSYTNEQNLTPSDGPAAGDDGHVRETDLSNDQLSAPIEALRGLADAAAAAAAEESEGHTSNDSSDEKGPQADGASGRPAKEAGDVDSAPTLQLVDEGGKRMALEEQQGDAEGGGRSPRKKRRRDPIADPTNGAAGANNGLESKGGAIDTTLSVSTSANAGGNGAFSHSPSTANTSSGTARSSKMEAPGLISSAPGDLVTLGLVNETDAMRLFDTFQKGVPKFISIFHLEDEPMTTEEAYHYVRTTSYFLFNVMLAIGAKVECGGKSPSRLYQTCMAQAKRNAKDTMFSPVEGKAAVQAMVLLAAYSENGWLPLGLSIRMAQELGLDRSFQKLMLALPASGYIRHPPPPPPPKHLTFYHNSPQSSHYTGSPTDVNSVGGESVEGKAGASANAAGVKAAAAVAAANRHVDAAAKDELDELRDLARGSRLWFFLFLFDHQSSYGAGRPAMLSKHYVRNCRSFLNLNYPLTVKTDARFISTLELLIIRETHYDAMAPYDQPVDARMLSKMRRVTEELNEWHQYWSSDFEGRGYGQDSFFQQSLVLQCASAELYLSCTALRGIRDAKDADQMGPEQKELIIQATRAADTCLSISVNAKEYREMLGWAPHYTHVTAAFACVFLIKIARLFPRQVDTYGIFSNAERLASRLAEVPAAKYARVIRILLAQAWKKIADLSPAIGLYAALGAEATRPGAITPAEIKTGGPSDSGISLLYKLLQDHQNGQMEAEDVAGGRAGAEGEMRSSSNNANGTVTARGGSSNDASGTHTPGLADLADNSKWLMTGISSPSVGVAGMLGGFGVAGSGALSPNKVGMSGLFSHRGSISGVDHSTTGLHTESIPWSSFLAPHTPSSAQTAGGLGGDSSLIGSSSHQPIQLPLWMQESTGSSVTDMTAFEHASSATTVNETTSSADTKNPSATGGSWGHQDHYRSPLPRHATGNQYTSTSYQTPQSSLPNQQLGSNLGSQLPPHHQTQHRHSNSLTIPPSPAAAQMQNNNTTGAPASFVASTNFDNVLSDLGLPLDGLDGLFVDLPINAPTVQSNYSV